VDELAFARIAVRLGQATHLRKFRFARDRGAIVRSIC